MKNPFERYSFSPEKKNEKKELKNENKNEKEDEKNENENSSVEAELRLSKTLGLLEEMQCKLTNATEELSKYKQRFCESAREFLKDEKTKQIAEILLEVATLVPAVGAGRSVIGALNLCRSVKSLKALKGIKTRVGIANELMKMMLKKSKKSSAI